ncbi:hypothetical protein ACJRO7_034424 [Eucalyptus globulus]|uniref:Uncharacterized protein n=1 Tax=Eucalyptus globulus TaxID=34317 RepID=A0ABD3J3Q0_EUCGL
MARFPRVDKSNSKKTVKKGSGRHTWSVEEDQKLVAYIKRYGIWNWTHMAEPAGLARTGKSCRLRWMNYLRPNISHGNITQEEEEIIINLHLVHDKNYWNTRLKKRFLMENLQMPTACDVKVNCNHNYPLSCQDSSISLTDATKAENLGSPCGIDPVDKTLVNGLTSPGNKIDEVDGEQLVSLRDLCLLEDFEGTCSNSGTTSPASECIYSEAVYFGESYEDIVKDLWGN